MSIVQQGAQNYKFDIFVMFLREGSTHQNFSFLRNQEVLTSSAFYIHSC